MCVRCSEVPSIDPKSVPIKFLRKALIEKEVIEAVDGPVVRTLWYKTKDSYIASMDYQYGDDMADTVNFTFLDA